MDATRGAQQAMTAASGGTLTVRGADGTSYALLMPPGALPADTIVSMTPLTAVAGSPLSGGFSNGVQFGPEGLQLNTAATLTIKPAAPIPLTKLIGFGYTGQGDQFHLEPVAGDGSTIVMAVRHFSGQGNGQGTAADATQMAAQHPPAAASDNLSQQIAALLAQWRNGVIDNATFHTNFGIIATTYYNTNIKPLLEAGLDSDAAYDAGVVAAIPFLQQLLILGYAPDEVQAIQNQIDALLLQGFNNKVARIRTQCANTRDYNLIERFVVAQRQGQILGFLPEQAIDYSPVAPCGLFSIVATPDTATVEINSAQLYNLKLLNQQGQPLINVGSLQFKWGAADPTIASVSPVGSQSGDAIGLMGGTTTIVPSLSSAAYTATSMGLGDLHVTPGTLIVKPKACTPYLAVKSWQGNIAVTYDTSASGNIGVSIFESVTLSHHLNYSFNLTGSANGGWIGTVTGGQANIADVDTTTGPAGSSTLTWTASAIGGGSAFSSLDLTIDQAACTYDLFAALAADETGTPSDGPPGMTSVFADGARRFGSLPSAPAGPPPPLSIDDSLPAHGVAWATQSQNARVNAFVPGMGAAGSLQSITGDSKGAAHVVWTLTPNP